MSTQQKLGSKQAQHVICSLAVFADAWLNWLAIGD